MRLLMLGMFFVVFGAAFGGKIALMLYAHKRPRPLRYGMVLALIGSVFGALLDTALFPLSILLGLVSPTVGFDPRYVVGTYALYMTIGVYLTSVVYYRRLIPFSYGHFMRRRP